MLYCVRMHATSIYGELSYDLIYDFACNIQNVRTSIILSSAISST